MSNDKIDGIEMQSYGYTNGASYLPLLLLEKGVCRHVERFVDIRSVGVGERVELGNDLMISSDFGCKAKKQFEPSGLVCYNDFVYVVIKTGCG